MKVIQGQLRISVLVVILLSLFCSLNANALKIGDMAPDFTLKSLEGTNLKLAEQQGQIILLNFWASWCGPCRQEMPILQKLHEKYQELGVAVWGVNVEQENQAGRDFLDDLNLSFPIFFDETNAISANYNVEAMPTTVLIDRDGKVRYVFRGFKKGYEKKYAKAIKQLIRE
ncbi:MAG: TlpA family protein disulfide reductase [Colwellia sp.]|nr:TlpA family protein disulfide reductase [Colwellia sp.]